MPKVNNPSLLPVLPVIPLDHLLDHLRDGGMGSVQHTRIGIALDGNRPIANRLEDLFGSVEPVEPDNVVAEVARGVQGVPRSLGEDDHGNGVQAEIFELCGEVLGDISQVGL